MVRLTFFLLLLMFTTKLQSQGVIPKEKDDQYKYNQLFLGIGYPFIVNSKDFIEDFQDYLGASENTFSANTLLQFQFKLKPIYDIRIGLDVSYYRLTLNDTYSLEALLANAKYQRDFSQEVDVSNIPIFLTFDYVPYPVPYKSYVGFGVGICYSSLTWLESFSSSYRFDHYIPGEHINEDNISPCFKLFTGVELSFDETLDYSFLGSLCFELSYVFYSGSVKFFENTSQQNYSLPVDLSRDYKLFPSSLNLSMLVSFNMSEKFFIRNKDRD